MRAAAVLLAVPILLAGCIDLRSATESDPVEQAGSQAERPVVIALLDTGTHPYYHLYDLDDDTIIGSSIPASMTRVQFGPDGPNPRERDWPLWKTLEPETLYHFAGTRLLGISFDLDRRSFDQEHEYPYVYDADFHGVATSYFAARAAPDAIIVAVQIGLGPCEETTCLIGPGMAEGMEWIAQQDWIDIVSVSLGLPGNLPDPGAVHPDVARYVRASEEAARKGMIVLNGAGNDVSPSLQGHFNGPPWIITVGGIEPAAKGEHVRSAKGVDVVANFTDFGPMYGDGENDTAWRSGTSFATPIVAGTLASALGQIQAKEPGRSTTTREMRDALNASAVYFETLDWNPSPPGRKPLPDDVLDYTSLPIVVQAQMGWGYVDSSLASEIARRVLEGDLSIPTEKSQAEVFQPAWQHAREEFWAAYRR